jgi:hypothetical protein
VANYANVFRVGGNIGTAAHTELPDKLLFSPEGLAAAKQSDMWEGCSRRTVKQALDVWIAGPFHRPSLLFPGLAGAGFDVYTAPDGCWAMCLHLDLKPTQDATLKPVMFPSAGAVISLRTLSLEWPDVLGSCPGFTKPSGLPITLQFGPGANPKVIDHSIRANGVSFEHCFFDQNSYDNPDRSQKELGRAALASFGELVLIPRAPLVPGVTYSVAVKTDRSSDEWSFTVASRKEPSAH